MNELSGEQKLEGESNNVEQELGEPTLVELAEFCRNEWGFSEDEMSQIIESDDFDTAISDISMILQENYEITDDEMFAALLEHELIEIKEKE